MPDRVRFLFFTLGDRRVASSRVRAYWVCEALEHLGATCRVFPGPALRRFPSAIRAIFQSDTVVFQKRFSPRHRVLAHIARLLGKSVYFDIDDAPSRNSGSAAYPGAIAMAKLADGVFAGSEALRDWAAKYNPSVSLIETRLDVARYPVRSDSDLKKKLCIGWVGNGQDYQDDLIDILGPALDKLAARVDFRFKIVGGCDCDNLHRFFGLGRPYDVEIIDQIDWSDPSAFVSAVGTFDIGVYPLKASRFNAHKCGFKALEYMALGLPVIASNVGCLDKIVAAGASGHLVNDPGEWDAALLDVATRPVVRSEMGKEGRRIVEDGYAVELSAAAILEAVTRSPKAIATGA